jgi:hypothetical protein
MLPVVLERKAYVQDRCAGAELAERAEAVAGFVPSRPITRQSSAPTHPSATPRAMPPLSSSRKKRREREVAIKDVIHDAPTRDLVHVERVCDLRQGRVADGCTEGGERGGSVGVREGGVGSQRRAARAVGRTADQEGSVPTVSSQRHSSTRMLRTHLLPLAIMV